MIGMSDTHTCPDCGDTFDSERGMKTHRGQQHTPPYQNESVLRKLYQKRGLSIAEVADKLGCAIWQVQKYMDRHGIETRQAPQSPSTPPCHQFKQRGDGSVGLEYEIVQTRIDGELHTVSIHRLIAVAIGELEPGDMKNMSIDIHHKSGHGLDNRHSNLEALSRAAHLNRHSD